MRYRFLGIRLAILLTLLTKLSFCQSQPDYLLYSKVIENFINYGIEQDVRTDQVVIITKYSPKDNHVSYYGNEFLKSDEQMFNIVLQYDSMKLRLFHNSYVTDAIRLLEGDFFQTPLIDKSKFNLNVNISTIKARQFERLFKTLFRRRIEHGWKKFYARYPGSHGVFEFSKVVYNGNFACFYVGRHSNGLSGSGDLVIAENLDGNWRIVSYVNIWMS